MSLTPLGAWKVLFVRGLGLGLDFDRADLALDLGFDLAPALVLGFGLVLVLLGIYFKKPPFR